VIYKQIYGNAKHSWTSYGHSVQSSVRCVACGVGHHHYYGIPPRPRKTKLVAFCDNPATVWCVCVCVCVLYCWYSSDCRSQWLRIRKRGSAATYLLRLRIRIPISISCESLWVVMQKSVRWTDRSSWGVLSSVVCLFQCHIETSSIRRCRPTRVTKLWTFKLLKASIFSRYVSG